MSALSKNFFALKSIKVDIHNHTHTHTQSTTEAAKCQLDPDERHDYRKTGLSKDVVLARPKSAVASMFQSQTWRTFYNLWTRLLPQTPTGCTSQSCSKSHWGFLMYPCFTWHCSVHTCMRVPWNSYMHVWILHDTAQWSHSAHITWALLCTCTRCFVIACTVYI